MSLMWPGLMILTGMLIRVIADPWIQERREKDALQQANWETFLAESRKWHDAKKRRFE